MAPRLASSATSDSDPRCRCHGCGRRVPASNMLLHQEHSCMTAAAAAATTTTTTTTTATTRVADPVTRQRPTRTGSRAGSVPVDAASTRFASAAPLRVSTAARINSPDPPEVIDLMSPANNDNSSSTTPIRTSDSNSSSSFSSSSNSSPPRPQAEAVLRHHRTNRQLQRPVALLPPASTASDWDQGHRSNAAAADASGRWHERGNAWEPDADRRPRQRQRQGQGQQQGQQQGQLQRPRASPDFTMENEDDVIGMHLGPQQQRRHTTATAVSGAEWTCPRCTLRNPLRLLECDACASPQPTDVPISTAGIDIAHWDAFLPHLAAMPAPVDLHHFLSYDDSDHPDDEQDELINDALVLSMIADSERASSSSTPTVTARSGIVTNTMSGARVGAVLQPVLMEQQHDQQVATVPTRRQHEPSRRRTSTRASRNAMDPPTERQQQQQQIIPGRPHYRRSFRIVSTRTSDGRLVTAFRTRGPDPGHDDPIIRAMMQSIMMPGGRGDPFGGAAAAFHDADENGNDNNVPHRNTMNMTYEQLLQAFGTGTERWGADETLIQALPVTKITNADVQRSMQQHKNNNENTRNNSNSDESTAECCAICLESFIIGADRKTMPCWHSFHADCLDPWLRTNASCPVCKFRLERNTTNPCNHK